MAAPTVVTGMGPIQGHQQHSSAATSSMHMYSSPLSNRFPVHYVSRYQTRLSRKSRSVDRFSSFNSCVPTTAGGVSSAVLTSEDEHTGTENDANEPNDQSGQSFEIKRLPRAEKRQIVAPLSFHKRMSSGSVQSNYTGSPVDYRTQLHYQQKQQQQELEGNKNQFSSNIPFRKMCHSGSNYFQIESNYQLSLRKQVGKDSCAFTASSVNSAAGVNPVIFSLSSAASSSVLDANANKHTHTRTPTHTRTRHFSECNTATSETTTTTVSRNENINFSAVNDLLSECLADPIFQKHCSKLLPDEAPSHQRHSSANQTREQQFQASAVGNSSQLQATAHPLLHHSLPRRSHSGLHDSQAHHPPVHHVTRTPRLGRTNNSLLCPPTTNQTTQQMSYNQLHSRQPHQNLHHQLQQKHQQRHVYSAASMKALPALVSAPSLSSSSLCKSQSSSPINTPCSSTSQASYIDDIQKFNEELSLRIECQKREIFELERVLCQKAKSHQRNHHPNSHHQHRKTETEAKTTTTATKSQGKGSSQKLSSVNSIHILDQVIQDINRDGESLKHMQERLRGGKNVTNVNCA